MRTVTSTTPPGAADAVEGETATLTGCAGVTAAGLVSSSIAAARIRPLAACGMLCITPRKAFSVSCAVSRYSASPVSAASRISTRAATPLPEGVAWSCAGFKRRSRSS